MRSHTLAVHPGALGDVLLAVPALRGLRRRASGAPLVLAAEPRIGALLAALGVVDRAVPFDSLRLDTFFTAAPDAVETLRDAARVVCWFGARDPDLVRNLSRVVPGVSIAPAVGAASPVWEHLALTAAPGEAHRLEPVTVPGALVAEGRRLLEGAGWDGRSRLVMLHPGAGGAAKRWPTEGFRAVAARLRSAGVTVVLHRGPADAEPVAALRSALRGEVLVIEEPPLPALAGALANVDAYLGNDSGISHLAAAVAAPAIALFTAAARAWRPWARQVLVLEITTTSVVPAELGEVVAALDVLMRPRRADTAAGARQD